jgi:carbon-monoxide dehydrogenase small subunit
LPIAPERTVEAAQPASARSDTAAASTASAPGPAPDKPGTTIRQSFTIAHPRARVWDFFTRLDQVAACMPGASLTAAPSDDHLQGKIRVKLGPISADFAGEADIQRDPINWSGLIHGSGRDVRSSSATRGEVHYALFEENGAAATRVDIDLGFTLTGSLAQFSRSGLVNDLAGRLTAEFAKNLQARMDRAVGAPGIGPDNAGPAAELRAGALVASIIWARLKAFFRSLSGR